MNHHLKNLLNRCPELVACQAEIESAAQILAASYRQGGKLLLCGNGGSAADADHWAGELLKGFGSKRPLAGELRKQLGDALADKLQGALSAIPLTGLPALASAWANDCDAEYLYAQLVLGLGRPGDVLVGISTSGNARNVAHAVEAANALGLKTVGLTGSSGGRLRELAGCCIRVPASETYRIQEFHLPIYHCLSLMLEDEFFPQV